MTVVAGGEVLSVLIVQLVVNAGLALTLFTGLSRSTPAALRARIDKDTFVTMARFGVSVLVAGVAFQVLLQGPPTVLAGHAVTATVAFYAVPSVMMMYIVSLMGAASFAFAPFASAQSVAKDRTRLAEIFRSNVRMTVLLAVPIAGYLAVLGEPLLVAWIGDSFAKHAAGPLRYLGIAACILALSAPPADVLRGLGMPAWVAGYTIGTAILTVTGSLLLVGPYGATGVAAALAIGLAIGTSVLIVLVPARLLDIAPSRLGRATGAPALAAGGAIALFAVGAELTTGFAGAVVTGAVGVAVYAVVVFRWVLDDRERRVFAEMRPVRRRTASNAT